MVFGFKHGNFKTPQELHFVTKKDRCLIFHIHDLNWSNLGFDQKIQIGIKIQKKNQENEKTKDIAFLCHIYSNHKQGL